MLPEVPLPPLAWTPTSFPVLFLSYIWAHRPLAIPFSICHKVWVCVYVLQDPIKLFLLHEAYSHPQARFY